MTELRRPTRHDWYHWGAIVFVLLSIYGLFFHDTWEEYALAQTGYIIIAIVLIVVLDRTPKEE